jgi:hypothetical protein
MDIYAVPFWVLGYCPTCFAVVPTAMHAQHAQWHVSRNEPHGELLLLPEPNVVERAKLWHQHEQARKAARTHPDPQETP